MLSHNFIVHFLIGYFLIDLKNFLCIRNMSLFVLFAASVFQVYHLSFILTCSVFFFLFIALQFILFNVAEITNLYL